MDRKQKYIYSAWADWVLIIAPPFLCLALVIAFAPYFTIHHEIEPFMWLILVLMIDVSHVYSTIYRTYLDPEMQRSHKLLLYGIPIASWAIGMLLYAFGDLVFWRVLAYLALFHFIRQQYGFFRIYERNENLGSWRKRVSHAMIYAATLYPVVVWHLVGTRNFTWFVQNDFILAERHDLIPYATLLYIGLWTTYLYFEIKSCVASKFINIPKNMVLVGTALSWYFGIVYYNSDLVFTLLNIVSHGIPYMALVWMHGNKRLRVSGSTFSSTQLWVFSVRGVLLFITILMLLAFVEETLWDTLIWHDHPEYFDFSFMWGTDLAEGIKMLLVPLLAVPQMTHYVLDGFIWKIKPSKPSLSAV
ncbi:MAG TPA: hypothetical protein VL947_06610 [Cytophagales bacterium]|nr:hypothetical protein [Cytophagales bacterium]